MVEISLSGSGEGPGWETAPGYSTAVLPVESSVRVVACLLEAHGQELEICEARHVDEPGGSSAPADDTP